MKLKPLYKGSFRVIDMIINIAKRYGTTNNNSTF